MTRINDIYELAEEFDIDIEDDDLESTLKPLCKAIEKGKIALNSDELFTDYPLINLFLNKPIKMSDGEKTNEVNFKCLSGDDRKSIQNSKEDKRGEVIHKIICRRTNISQVGLKEHNSTDVSLLEAIFTFFC